MSNTDPNGDTQKRILEGVSEFATIFKSRLASASEALPANLYHYTDFHGFKGILETGSLWATYSRTMNDPSEQEYGDKVVRAYLRQREVGTDTAVSPEPKSQSNYRTFVTCFCGNSEILSMWIAYAARGGGYCLEFERIEGNLAATHDPYPKPLKFRITYGDEIPTNVAEILQFAREFARRGPMEAFIAEPFVRALALRFKHPAFCHENEFRIAIIDPPPAAMKFRAGDFGIKPYVEMGHPPNSPDGIAVRGIETKPKLPLRRIVIGPTLRQNEFLLEATKWMLEKYGYSDVDVEHSSIPYQI